MTEPAAMTPAAPALSDAERERLSDLKIRWLASIAVFLVVNVVGFLVVVVAGVEALQSANVLKGLAGMMCLLSYTGGGVYWLYRYTGWRWFLREDIEYRIYTLGVLASAIGSIPIIWFTSTYIDDDGMSFVAFCYASMLLGPILGGLPLAAFRLLRGTAVRN